MSTRMMYRSVGAMFEPWTWLASFGFFAFLQQFIPREYSSRIRRLIRSWLHSFNPYVYCHVHEFENAIPNTLYSDTEIYLSALTSESVDRINLSKSKGTKTMTVKMAHDQERKDKFEGVKIEWTHYCIERPKVMWTARFETTSDEKRHFTLQIHRKEKDVLERYMAHIQEQAKLLKRAARDLRLYTNSKSQDSYYLQRSPWTSVNFVHPATFDTLALDGDLKRKISEDLDRFAEGEAYYRRVGRAWKRGYLLYGPPGTGKSSMIAAIANKMRYDIYDLELTEVESNVQLRKLLLNTSNKSVIVIEDIDCSLDLSGQRKKKKKKPSEEPNPAHPMSKPSKEQSKVTLSGLLNFVDGLWSCCGAERIFIFTTNYMEKLDPALLRPGRMDMHIHLSYCTFSAFQVLARNYLQIEDHELFDKLETAFEGSYMTPAEVSEIFVAEQDFPTRALENLLVALDNHRVKPSPPPPDSDDEQEDEKEVAAKSTKGKDDQEKETTSDVIKTSNGTIEPKAPEKQNSIRNKTDSDDSPVKAKPKGASETHSNGTIFLGGNFRAVKHGDLDMDYAHLSYDDCDDSLPLLTE
ncbi:hypothetical protein R1sor_022164 [Riccia sorocarpa]|uniref:AAA+ ATPase domain-containing protein n=1 Tax=Riccia sorocarpa TaxID=122646 RepID=A0ABD3GJT5_9MARC